MTTSQYLTTRTTYTYDNNGNLTVENAGGTRTTNTWDKANRLTQVQKSGMTTNQYTYSGDGQRVKIIDSAGTRTLFWDGENLLTEKDSTGPIATYTYEPRGYGNLLSQRRGSTTSIYLFDGLGSTRQLTNSAGTVTDTYHYRAFGETFSTSGSTVNLFRWVGELGYYYDADRLAYYLRARPYSPTLARFLSSDPLGHQMQLESLAYHNWWSLFCYALNSPLAYLDPSGLQAANQAIQNSYDNCIARSVSRYENCIMRGVAVCCAFMVIDAYYQLNKVFEELKEQAGKRGLAVPAGRGMDWNVFLAQNKWARDIWLRRLGALVAGLGACGISYKIACGSDRDDAFDCCDLRLSEENARARGQPVPPRTWGQRIKCLLNEPWS